MECEILKEFFEKHKEKIITLLLCGVLFIIVLSVLALISGAIMKVFGFEYRSIGSIILFFIIATIISYPRLDCWCISKGFVIFRQSIYSYSNGTLFNLRHICNFLGIENYRLLYANYFSRRYIYFCYITNICIIRG
mgnify:CR=1 FL=1